jgi:glycosyltransferase involved in cell wall biosynthesis
MTITVIVPTYRRPVEVRRCLAAIASQSRRPDEIIVVVRDSDDATWKALERIGPEAGPLRTVRVSEPGVVAAMNAGLAQSRCDVVALTDDDAAPRPDWLARIEAYFLSDPALGGVGGRDYVHHGGTTVQGAEPVVGKVQWFGRIIGNHHLGIGGPREVDVLKGVNCAYRRDAIGEMGFETRLRGSGAQVYWEVVLGLGLRSGGWKLVYDPALAVDHYEAARPGETRVGKFDAESRDLSDAAYNEALAVWRHLTPAARPVYALWSLFIGSTPSPGLLQAFRFTASHGTRAWRRFFATQRGKLSYFREPSRSSPTSDVRREAQEAMRR